MLAFSGDPTEPVNESEDSSDTGLLTQTLTIPDGVVTGCATHPGAFTDPALDPDPEVFASATPEEKEQIARAKRAAEDRAITVCDSCPIKDACESWAGSTDVFGVAGGTRQSERNPDGPDEIDKYLAEHQPPVVGPAAAAAAELRRRANRWRMLTPATMALYDSLALDGAADRATLIERMAQVVPPAQAESAVPRERAFATEEARRDAGARRYARNILRIQERRKAIRQYVEHDGEAVLRLDPIIAAAWRQWRRESA